MKAFPCIRRLLLALSLIVLALNIGCSGGGGGTGGTGVDPIEVEINAEIDTFLAGLNARNLDQAMGEVDSNLQYSRAGSVLGVYLGYTDFRNHLSAFLSGVSSVTVKLESRGVVPDGESLARVRGTLTYSYRDSAGTVRNATEDCEMYWERVARWGIKRLSGFNLVGLAFPPAP